ncbi:MAG: hypothetical protein HDQ97_08235 [Lachnospiraceae bacterium]|nr:hypothetical protein [Lachnospiraceae bacterium]
MKKLPIANSPINGYTIHGYPLSIMLNEPESQGWFYSNYIQLVCNPEFTSNFFDFKNICSIIEGDAWINWLYPGNPWLKCESLALYKDYDKKICETIIWAIQQNDYVVITLDEYYLHNKQNYNVRHNFHEILCYGFDEAEEIIYTLTYNERGIFAEVKINYKDIQKSYDYVREACNDKNNRINPIKLLSVNKDFYYPFNAKLVYDLLIDYMESKDTVGLTKQVYYNSSNMVYGIETYRLLEKYYLSKRDNYDIRPIHIIYEHKKCMILRLEYIFELFRDERFKNIAKEYEDMQKKCLMAKRMLVKYMYTLKSTNSISILIDSIFVKEQRQLERLIKVLQQYI